jgi:phosphoribosylformylglycinamidine synthase
MHIIRQSGFVSVMSCESSRLFFFDNTLSTEEISSISKQLLADPVAEEFVITGIDSIPALPERHHSIEVALLPGVTDPVAESLIWAVAQLGFPDLKQVATGQRFVIEGQLDPGDLENLATQVFSNPIIQRYEVNCPICPSFDSPSGVDSIVEIIPLREANDMRLIDISKQRRLSLNLAEMQAIRAYFQEKDREPTDVELEMLAQTWSEHCCHKTFKATITYTGPQPGTNQGISQQKIEGLLKTYIQAATERINKPWVHSAFVDNAGIISLSDSWDIAFKVETHNHPSALEPFGGANTGVGGVVRDILGVGARPIANTDVLCFGPQDLPVDDLPSGVLHPRRIADGVVRGIEDYGNKMGIPTVSGAVYYSNGYTSNPLVYCGCLGLLPADWQLPGVQTGDLIVVVGGRTGRDGLRGATFSSMDIDHQTGKLAGSAVQIGHPINEKQALEVILQARDEKLYHAITDCGAGGLSSAVGELASKCGAIVNLEHVPLKYPGLRPWEIWLSEAQERMVLAIPPENWARFETLCAIHDIQAVCIGEFSNTGHLDLRFGNQRVGDLDTQFVYDGIPVRQLVAAWEPHATTQSVAYPDINIPADLLALLSHPNIRSREDIIRRYDHEVQGGGAVKPLVGHVGHGPGDGTVLVPQGTVGKDVVRGVALTAGLCPAYGAIDPYTMAYAAIDEAIRNAAAVGADPDRIAILDNFCWGNPDLPDRLGALVRCAQGCYDAAVAYGVPFISGKDSLNNEYTTADGTRHAIPGTLLISAIGVVPDVNHTVTMDLKSSGNLLYLIGLTQDDMGGSHYHLIHNIQGGVPPQPVSTSPEIVRAVHRAIQAGLIKSCHDCSEGGLAVALAEMCIAGGLGATIDLKSVHDISDEVSPDTQARDRIGFFAESIGRFVVEVNRESVVAFEKLFQGLPCIALGYVNTSKTLDLKCNTGDCTIPLTDLETAWRGEAPATQVAPELSSRNKEESSHKTPALNHAPRVLILHARGTNRDHDAALACDLAGGRSEIVTLNQLANGDTCLLDYAMIVLPGGFSFGDDLGAGTIWAVALDKLFSEDIHRFVESGRPVLGICNGFQTLIKTGLLPGPSFQNISARDVTLTYNESQRFECRWVYLKPNLPGPCLFTKDLDDLIYCPVAHGEGRVVVSQPSVLDQFQSQGLVALTYVDRAGNSALYPANPNGSVSGIAGLTNAAGNVLGLMPHPENHIFSWQHPRWHRGEHGMTGLSLFENGLKNT